jgi:hypothetical protein
MEQEDRLPDALELAWAAENHHRDVPSPCDYQGIEPPFNTWVADLHALQGFDRLDAITSRPYVAEREGARAMTAAGAVAVALAADPRGGSPALEPIVNMDGWTLDLEACMLEVAEVLV